MATVNLPSVSGTDVKEIVNAIEKQRKEMEFLLTHLNDDNIIGLKAKKIQVGNSTLEVSIEGIKASVSGFNDRMQSAEAYLNILPGLIESKVSAVDFNGETIMSMITQTPENITLIASYIDLNGITRVNGELFIGDPDVMGWKTLRFTNAANISASGFGTDGMSELQLNTNTVNFTQAANLIFRSGGANVTPTYVSGKIDFQYATITGLTVIASFG